MSLVKSVVRLFLSSAWIALRSTFGFLPPGLGCCSQCSGGAVQSSHSHCCSGCTSQIVGGDLSFGNAFSSKIYFGTILLCFVGNFKNLFLSATTAGWDASQQFFHVLFCGWHKVNSVGALWEGVVQVWLRAWVFWKESGKQWFETFI